ncbi:MTH865 family protein [Methanobrevibacter curvatus]|uniref:MTH865-like family protein n=1 Tax=Methanobrevibacter curvatus TaxID=49547 RepID=A0A165ZRQ1_9EURY|nr:MTH865 family protein [Methanobrevibacter curvatus]KZX11076.1 MTH865-like family protein [Methanobrevibacter curvatus]
MSVKEEIYSQIVGALEGASFPIGNPEDLFAAFPDGADTTCKSGDVVLKASDAGKVLTGDDFPFKSAENVAQTIVDRAGL